MHGFIRKLYQDGRVRQCDTRLALSFDLIPCLNQGDVPGTSRLIYRTRRRATYQNVASKYQRRVYHIPKQSCQHDLRLHHHKSHFQELSFRLRNLTRPGLGQDSSYCLRCLDGGSEGARMAVLNHRRCLPKLLGEDRLLSTMEAAALLGPGFLPLAARLTARTGRIGRPG